MDKLLTKIPFLTYICGNTASGKTNLAKYIIKCLMHKKKIDYVMVFSPTSGISDDGTYSFLPKELIHNQITDNKIHNIMTFQKKQKKAGKNLKLLLIFDDCIGAYNKNSKVLNNLIISHRHYNISIIFLSQYLKGINPQWRSNFSYLFIAKPLNFEDVKKYRDIYFADVKDLPSHFNKYCGEQYRFLFVDLLKSPSEKYKSVKAPCVKPFKISFQ
jgi:Cdc6-like AAA superfamily ATPase